MSEVLEFSGRAFVAGLFWADPGEDADRAARRQRAWSVAWAGQTGWVPKDARLRGVTGVPSLAACVAGLVGSAAGRSERGAVAALRADDDRVALVRIRDGTIVRGGDEVFETGEAAADSLGTARAEGAEVFGTPGAVADGGGFVELDPAELAGEGSAAGLERTGGGSSPLRVAGGSLALLAVVAAGVWVVAPGMVAGLFGGGETSAVQAIVEQEADVLARIDSVALVEECGAAQVQWPPYLPAWEIRSIDCHGWFEEPELIGLRPELEGRAVMVVRWALPGQYVAALHRRIAEEHLGGWYLASVVETGAWAVMPLGPVLGRAEGEPSLSYLAFRREVDRHLGMQGARIDYAGESEAVAVTVVLGHGLGRIARLVGDIPGFELVSLSRGGGGAWVLKARPVAGFEVRESVFRELADRVRAGEAVSL